MTKTNPDYEGIDTVLNWMLIPASLHRATGMPNSARSRSTKGSLRPQGDAYIQIEEMDENMGYEVLHGIVD